MVSILRCIFVLLVLFRHTTAIIKVQLWETNTKCTGDPTSEEDIRDGECKPSGDGTQSVKVVCDYETYKVSGAFYSLHSCAGTPFTFSLTSGACFPSNEHSFSFSCGTSRPSSGKPVSTVGIVVIALICVGTVVGFVVILEIKWQVLTKLRVMAKYKLEEHRSRSASNTDLEVHLRPALSKSYSTYSTL